MENIVPIGKIVATFGVEGDLVLKHELGKKISLAKIEAVLLEEVKDSHRPYFLKWSSAKNDSETHLKVQSIESKEAAKALVNQKVWLLKEDFQKIAPKGSSLSLLGYQLYDGNTLLGSVEEILDQQHNSIIKTTYQGKEVLVPFNPTTTEKIDHKLQTLRMILPDGLLALYLGGDDWED